MHMKKDFNSVFKEALEITRPNEKEIKYIEQYLKKFIEEIEKNIKSLNITAEVFVGGSYAKKTLIKKQNYDIDIFVRFDRRHNFQSLSDLTQILLKKFREFKIRRIHGSRDYFQVKIKKNLLFEVIPVLKVKNAKEAENITDLSYLHVNYIRKKVKSEKILDDIKLAKAFCHANNCYGAESYINGFSGYSLELLIYHYKSFLKFLREMSKVKKEKVIIDIEKHHKNKNLVLMNLNSSKLNSPIILIDPTQKTRNASAALSEETFENFKESCKSFLAKPSITYFKPEKIHIEKIKKQAKRKKQEFILIEAKTSKQPGDVAGSKLWKFFNHLKEELEPFFEIKEKGFEYSNGKRANFFFVAKRKKEILIKGPEINDKENIKRFKKKHKSTFIRAKRIYSKQKIDFSLRKFIRDWKRKNKKIMNDMSILNLRTL